MICAMTCLRFLHILISIPLLASPLRIYVANSDDNRITVIDPSSNKVAGEIMVSPNPHGIVPSPDGSRFYVSSEGKDVLDVVDRKTSKIIRSIPIGVRPNNVAITADGRRVYVCIRGESWVDIVDTASLEKVKSVPVGKAPHNVYRSPDAKHMIATSMDENKLTFIDVRTETPDFAVPVGGIPRPVAIEEGPDQTIRRLFVQLSNLHGFAVVDYSTKKVVDKVLLPDGPPGAKPLIPATFSHGMSISPDRKQLWVTSLLDNSVSVFSLPELKRLTTIHVGRGPDWMVFTPDGRRCYVSNAGSNTVSSIDAISLKELTQIPVGKVPKRIIAAD